MQIDFAALDLAMIDSWIDEQRWDVIDTQAPLAATQYAPPPVVTPPKQPTRQLSFPALSPSKVPFYANAKAKRNAEAAAKGAPASKMAKTIPSCTAKGTAKSAPRNLAKGNVRSTAKGNARSTAKGNGGSDGSGDDSDDVGGDDSDDVDGDDSDDGDGDDSDYAGDAGDDDDGEDENVYTPQGANRAKPAPAQENARSKARSTTKENAKGKGKPAVEAGDSDSDAKVSDSDPEFIPKRRHWAPAKRPTSSKRNSSAKRKSRDNAITTVRNTSGNDVGMIKFLWIICSCR